MTITSFRRASPLVLSRWTLDAGGCLLLVEQSDSTFRSVPIDGARGWVELREEGLVGSRISLRLPPGEPGEDGGLFEAGCSFQGSAVRRGAEDEMVVEGQLRVGDRVDPLTLAVIPTRYHRRGDTELLDLDVSGSLPSGRCGATRVAGRIRILRAHRAA